MQPNPSAPTRIGGSSQTEFTVTGMTCNNCARHVTEAAQSVAGVASPMVSIEGKQATVRWSSGHEANVSAVVQAMNQAGYEAKSIIALISVGHWMEARGSARASSSLHAPMNLAPAIARRR